MEKLSDHFELVPNNIAWGYSKGSMEGTFPSHIVVSKATQFENCVFKLNDRCSWTCCYCFLSGRAVANCEHCMAVKEEYPFITDPVDQPEDFDTISLLFKACVDWCTFHKGDLSYLETLRFVGSNRGCTFDSVMMEPIKLDVINFLKDKDDVYLETLERALVNRNLLQFTMGSIKNCKSAFTLHIETLCARLVEINKSNRELVEAHRASLEKGATTVEEVDTDIAELDLKEMTVS